MGRRSVERMGPRTCVSNQTKSNPNPPPAHTQAEARRRLPKAVYEYVASGSEDEQTLWENRQGFKRLLIWPRVLRDVSTMDTRCVLWGGGMNSYRAFPIVKDLHPIESTPHVRTHSLSLFGGTQRASMPVFISPAGVHCLMDKEGEAATARAARRAGGFRRMC